MTSCAWLWLYVGAFLMLAELLLPGFVIFFFGLSAATVGLLRFALGDTFTLTWQLAAFSAFTILERVGTDPTEHAFYKAFRDFNPLNDLGSG